MRLIYLGILCVLLTGCFKKFDDLRQDPEGVNTALPSSFLTNVLYTATTTLVQQGHTINNQLIQVSVLRQNDNEIHRYRILPSNYTTMWAPLYKPLVNVAEMKKLALASGDQNYVAIAYTLEAWIMQNITDTYGDVPFMQAVKGIEGNTTPAYDPQQQIYDSLIVYLDRANDLFVLNKLLGGEDILFNANNTVANVLKWKKFANSLRLRLLMRIEKKSTAYQDLIRNMLSNPTKYPLMTSVADGAALYYTGVTPYLNPFFSYRDFDYNQKLNYSSFFIDYLNNVGDPRLPVWATKGSGNVYKGVPTGYPVADQNVISNGSYSTFQIALKTNSLMGSILQYAEVEFLLAEACLKGYMTDNAKTHYDKGIQASMGYWGVTTVPPAFLNHASIAYNGTLEQIITQKYFALFGNGFEQWFEQRRTGFPVMIPGAEMENGGKMPARIPYPIVESLYNAQSYNTAVGRMGGDDINVKVWWQQ